MFSFDPRKRTVGNASYYRPEAPFAVEEYGTDEADSREAEKKNIVDVGRVDFLAR